MKMTIFIATVLLLFVLGGCAKSGVDTGTGTVLSQDTNTNFVLYVSNQSFALTPVDITITIDGKKVISSTFEVGEGKRRQHNWISHGFELTPGTHKLEAVSTKGDAKFEKEFEIKDKKHWAVLSYWYYPDQDGKKKFTFQIQNEQIYFE